MVSKVNNIKMLTLMFALSFNNAQAAEWVKFDSDNTSVHEVDVTSIKKIDKELTAIWVRTLINESINDKGLNITYNESRMKFLVECKSKSIAFVASTYLMNDEILLSENIPADRTPSFAKTNNNSKGATISSLACSK